MNYKLINHNLSQLKYYLSGIVVILFLSLFYTTIISQLFNFGSDYNWQDLFNDLYLRHVVTFSLYQAFLSTALSIGIGLVVARALFYYDFKGKNFVLRIFSLTFVLPSLVVILGIIGIYGSSGWLVKLSHLLGLDFNTNIYGLKGLLLAHVFFNMPLACRIFLQTLYSIPNQQRQLACQLNIRGWNLIRLIELPYLKQQIMPLFVLIFMLCFTSFAIVLTLGGGPKYTTLEVAIFQAITFDFDLTKAAMLAIIQFGFCFLLFNLSNLLIKRTDTNISSKDIWRDQLDSVRKFIYPIITWAAILFIALPLLNTIYDGLFASKLFSALQNRELWKATTFSLIMAPTAGLLSLILSLAILLTARRLNWNHHPQITSLMLNFGMLVLAIPTLVVTVGLFMLLRDIEMNNFYLFSVVILCNALAAMPFVLRVLYTPLNTNMLNYEKLSQSLGISGWQRWKIVEFKPLAAPLKYSFAFASALSLGDFSVIALFGNQYFTSLPRLLYQQLGNYRSQEASVTALILFLFCLVIFLIIERNYDNS